MGRRADLEVLEAVSSLVELFLGGPGLDGRDRVLGRVGFGCGGVLGCFGGSGEHLDDLLEGVSVGLDEGRVRVVGFGSGDGFGSGCRGGAAAAACTVGGAVAVWGWCQRGFGVSWSFGEVSIDGSAFRESRRWKEEREREREREV
ncbi:VQ motif-containing protein [Actinidia rufa]|uniref:VQ motif-containing protein n=1 Tax=Actinidia rufa TaxID=165716 RepID=A0A7J0G613_9ERIC|nr:VQ motif-containing protein [Actinidia rufa]